MSASCLVVVVVTLGEGHAATRRSYQEALACAAHRLRALDMPEGDRRAPMACTEPLTDYRLRVPDDALAEFPESPEVSA